MKTLHLLTSITIVSFFALTACSKKADDIMPASTQTTTSTPTTATQPTTTTQVTTGFQVKVDGKLYAPDFDYALAKSPGNDNYFAVYGLDSKTGDVVVLALPFSVGEGTSPINNVNVGMLSFNSNTEEYSTVNGGEGTVTITKKTATNMVGTFSFTAFDATGTKKRTLTEGSFNVTFR